MVGKKFKVSNAKKLGFLWTAFGLFIVIVLACSTLVSDFNDNILRYAIISLVIGLVSGIVVAIVLKESYLKITDHGFEIIKGKTVTSYSFSDFLGSNVVRHYTNGIYSGVTREIKVKDLKNPSRSKSINCNYLKKDVFAELVAYMGKSEFQENHSDEIPEGYFDSEKFFNIPQADLIKANKKSMITTLIVCLILSIAAIFVWWFILFEVSTIGFVILSIGTIIGASVFYVPTIIRYRRILSIPDHVTCDNLTLAIGNDSFTVDKISNVKMVPSSYKILTRDLIVITTEGIKYKYNFGDTKGGKKLTYSEYDALNTTIKLWCLNKGVNFMSILG